MAAISSLSGVGEQIERRLRRLSIETTDDLLRHFPRRYEDWRTITPIKKLRTGEEAVIRASIADVRVEQSPRRQMIITHATLKDETGTIPAIWFGIKFLTRLLRPGRTFFFRGLVERDYRTRLLTLIAPAFEREGGLRPIYPETAGLTSFRLRSLIAQALATTQIRPDQLPSLVARRERLMPYAMAIRAMHQPTSLVQLNRARERIAFGELFTFLNEIVQARAMLARHHSPCLSVTKEQLQRFSQSLPFRLTDDQRRAAWAIICDLQRPHPMHRLLQGDVGSGKTAVAAMAAYVTSQSGYQTVWLAPTEILAHQHQETLLKLLEPFKIPVNIWTKSRKTPPAQLPTPNSVIVGTHALLSDSLDFQRLGLVIVDEEHRFGVAQRSFLRNHKSHQGELPHFLSMTATPIPRTLAQVIYADLDVTCIREKPPGRKEVITRVLRTEERHIAEDLIKREILAGRQAYVICPLIDGTEDDTRSVRSEHERLTRHYPKFRVGMLHGRLKPSEKERVMGDFVSGNLDLLVTTTVIEVGVDVPNASVMLIEGADRYGLAQLHQLRGRVGRGECQSYCFLLADSWDKKTRRRLQAMEETSDGLVLAETDLRLRGPGEAIGTRQSGFPEFRVASLYDIKLLDRVRAAVRAYNQN